MIASNCEAEDGNEKVEDGMGPLEMAVLPERCVEV
jgi:hypothetical protein